MDLFIAVISIGVLFIAAWLYFACGVFDKWPQIVCGGYKRAEQRAKILAAFDAPSLLVGNIDTYIAMKKEKREARDKCFKRIVGRAERIAREEAHTGYHAMKMEPRPWITFPPKPTRVWWKPWTWFKRPYDLISWRHPGVR